jgi:hypothetical protein
MSAVGTEEAVVINEAAPQLADGAGTKDGWGWQVEQDHGDQVIRDASESSSGFSVVSHSRLADDQDQSTAITKDLSSRSRS